MRATIDELEEQLRQANDEIVVRGLRIAELTDMVAFRDREIARLQTEGHEYRTIAEGANEELRRRLARTDKAGT
jgi:hypothetical protein